MRCGAVQSVTGLREVVPAYLAAACPALRTLTLLGCTFMPPIQQQQQQQQQAPSISPLSPPLQALRVLYPECLSRQVLAAALASLPHLSSATLYFEDADMANDLTRALPAAAGQLTHLNLLCRHTSRVEIDALTRLLDGPDVPLSMRQLRQIELGCTWVNDAGLRSLVAHLPLLTHVKVHNFQLLSSHADAACNWEELRITNCLIIQTLTQLPLRGIRKLEVHDVRSTHYSSQESASSAADLAAALAAAPDCVFSCTHSPCLYFRCHVEELALLLPRWQCGVVKNLNLSPSGTDCLTPAVVGALASLLERTPSCTELHITDFGPPDAASSPLLTALISTEIREVHLHHQHMTEAQLLAWCAGGALGRPIVVRLIQVKLAARLASVRQALKKSSSTVTLERLKFIKGVPCGVLVPVVVYSPR